MKLCPHPDCNKELIGHNAFLCPDHFFELLPDDARTLMRIKVRASRVADAVDRAELESRLASYIQAAIRRTNCQKTNFKHQENFSV